MSLVCVVLAALCATCSKQGDSVVLMGDGTRVSSEEIDRDPLALLPGGVVGLIHIDAQAAFNSEAGGAAAQLVTNILPLSTQANFDTKRDVRRVILGFYSLQGADVAVVIQGSFDPDAIRSAAMSGAPTPLGTPLSRLEYAGNDLFVAGGIGFVVATKQTIIAGNETGIRRTLDRIRDKRIVREVPDWMVQLIETPQASIVGVGDLSAEPQVAAAAAQAPFLQGVTVVRVLGNFQPPGVHFAGSFTYPDAESAQRAAQSLEQVGQLAAFTNLLAVFGLTPPLRDLRVNTEQRDVQFVLAVDAQSAIALLDLATRFTR